MQISKVILFITASFICVIKSHAQTPEFEWAKSVGSTLTDAGYGVTTDAAGNVYTTGVFYGTVDFNPGSGTYELTSAGSSDIFITKFNSDGNFQWAIRYGDNALDIGKAITYSNGSIYITGQFGGTVDFDPGTGTSDLTASGFYDFFVCRLNTNGNFVWARNIGAATGDDIANSITVDVNDNVYVTGEFEGPTDFNPGAGNFTLTSFGSCDAFILKLDDEGDFVWAKNFGSTSDEVGLSIKADNGSVYTTGSYRLTVDFDPGVGIYNLTSTGTYDIFISKLDASGNFQWAVSMGTTGGDSGTSITTDPSGNVCTTGIFDGTGDFNPGPYTFNLTSVDQRDVFISKLDNNGNFIWARSMGGDGDDEPNSIATDASGNIYTTGSFESIADFNPGISTFNITSAGNEDIFVSALDGGGNFVWATATGSTSGDIGNALAIDSTGSVLITGEFQLTSDFNPEAAVSNLTSLGGDDIFIQKLSSTLSTPSISVVTPVTSIATCIDGTAKLSITASGTTNLVYQWQKFNVANYLFENINNGYVFDGATSSTLTITVSSNYVQGDYRCLVSGDLSIDAYSDVISLTVTLGGTVPTITMNESNTLTSTEGNSYQWYSSGEVIVGATTQTFLINTFEYGVYKVEVTKNGCTSTSVDFIYLITEINEINSSIKVYPNPIEDHFIVNNNSGEVAVVNVCDQLGRILIKDNIHPGVNNIKSEKLSAGFYFLKVQSNKFESVVKLKK